MTPLEQIATRLQTDFRSCVLVSSFLALSAKAFEAIFNLEFKLPDTKLMFFDLFWYSFVDAQ